MAPKAPQRRLTAQERGRIHALRHQAGWPYARISRALEIPYETVCYCALSLVTPQKPPSGRSPLLNTPLRQRLVSYATASHKQRLKPFEEIAYELNIHVNNRTLTKAFNKEGYYQRVATEKPFLTEKHINDRLF
ncbi:hypothetical protein CC86DRAFT_417992 [Ophiobolus disseminans]|uniref:Transposase Tc1-like domain-containing protein n=1 Tax=Ophiobolus disseminans TaxID=1469910 RepID=A0A6A6ZYJ1_9PLEO|nr:hypothetical protein CC86DRAFT_417992 [Ophiobolus disseminans]